MAWKRCRYNTKKEGLSPLGLEINLTTYFGVLRYVCGKVT